MVTVQMAVCVGAAGSPRSRTPPLAAARLCTECTPSRPCRNERREHLLSFTRGGDQLSEERLEESLRGKAEERGHVAGQVEDLGAAIAAQQLASDGADGAEVLALNLHTFLLDHAHLLLHTRVRTDSFRLPFTLLLQIQSHFSGGVWIRFQLLLGLSRELQNLLGFQV